MPGITAEPLDWPTIQSLYVAGKTAEDISRAIADGDPVRQRKIAGRIRTQAARQQWRNKAAEAAAKIAANAPKMPHNQPQHAEATHIATTQSKPLISSFRANSSVADSCNTPKMVLNLLEQQKKEYLANGATLAGKVLERAAKQAESGALPADPEGLRAIGEALLPFHRIGRDVFGLGAEQRNQTNLQINIAATSDIRTLEVVDVE